MTVRHNDQTKSGRRRLRGWSTVVLAVSTTMLVASCGGGGTSSAPTRHNLNLPLLHALTAAGTAPVKMSSRRRRIGNGQ